jgi:hypothetical protein
MEYSFCKAKCKNQEKRIIEGQEMAKHKVYKMSEQSSKGRDIEEGLAHKMKTKWKSKYLLLQ